MIWAKVAICVAALAVLCKAVGGLWWLVLGVLVEREGPR